MSYGNFQTSGALISRLRPPTVGLLLQAQPRKGLFLETGLDLDEARSSCVSYVRHSWAGFKVWQSMTIRAPLPGPKLGLIQVTVTRAHTK